MTDCKGKEILKGSIVTVVGKVLDAIHGNAGNDMVIMRTDELDAVTKQPRELTLNAKLVEVLDQ
ncbi:MAG: hypothetical protein FJ271_28475 [Planctomycetes bacterium]|nr:hypothetical protein [Planctomycetota bacterium]